MGEVLQARAVPTTKRVLQRSEGLFVDWCLSSVSNVRLSKSDLLPPGRGDAAQALSSDSTNANTYPRPLPSSTRGRAAAHNLRIDLHPAQLLALARYRRLASPSRSRTRRRTRRPSPAPRRQPPAPPLSADARRLPQWHQAHSQDRRAIWSSRQAALCWPGVEQVGSHRPQADSPGRRRACWRQATPVARRRPCHFAFPGPSPEQQLMEPSPVHAYRASAARRA